MQNNIRGNFLTHTDLGWTEDEYNNFFIDMWKLLQERDALTEVKQIKITLGDAVTIKLRKNDHYK